MFSSTHTPSENETTFTNEEKTLFNDQLQKLTTNQDDPANQADVIKSTLIFLIKAQAQQNRDADCIFQAFLIVTNINIDEVLQFASKHHHQHAIALILQRYKNQLMANTTPTLLSMTGLHNALQSNQPSDEVDMEDLLTLLENKRFEFLKACLNTETAISTDDFREFFLNSFFNQASTERFQQHISDLKPTRHQLGSLKSRLLTAFNTLTEDEKNLFSPHADQSTYCPFTYLLNLSRSSLLQRNTKTNSYSSLLKNLGLHQKRWTLGKQSAQPDARHPTTPAPI